MPTRRAFAVNLLMRQVGLGWFGSVLVASHSQPGGLAGFRASVICFALPADLLFSLVQEE